MCHVRRKLAAEGLIRSSDLKSLFLFVKSASQPTRQDEHEHDDTRPEDARHRHARPGQAFRPPDAGIGNGQAHDAISDTAGTVEKIALHGVGMAQGRSASVCKGSRDLFAARMVSHRVARIVEDGAVRIDNSHPRL